MSTHAQDTSKQMLFRVILKETMAARFIPGGINGDFVNM